MGRQLCTNKAPKVNDQTIQTKGRERERRDEGEKHKSSKK